MTRLTINLLGHLQVSLDGEPVTGFDSDKVRGLLTYLAVESDYPHRREKLAGLLWPEWPERSARTNLRSSLANLRQVIGDHSADPPFLLISRQTLQFNQASVFSLDALDFSSLVDEGAGHPPSIETLEKATKLYRGSFLEGFSIPDSIPFEEWVVINREALQMKVSRALHILTEHYENSEIYDLALDNARRHLAIDPFLEEAHRQVMRILARSGQRSEALAQYEVCRGILREELDVDPQEETTDLYKTIKENMDLPKLDELPAMATAPKTEILKDRYHIGDELGRGSIGSVFLGRDVVNDRDVAVKLIPAAKLKSEYRANWIRELQSLIKLNHPNIARVYELGEEGGTVYLVMERVVGTTLAELLSSSETQFDKFENIIDLASQVCAALEHAHSHGVIHCELKPENLLMKPDGSLVLVGFGFSRPVAVRLSSESDLLDSVFYLAPELALGKGHDGRADLYSLGVILYKLTTGKLPFSGESPVAVISQHLHASIVPTRARNATIPPALDDLIQRLLSKNPNHRPDSATEVLRMFQSQEILNLEVGPIEDVSVLKRIGRGRMVGRKRELREASLLWSRALSRQRQVLLISGEAGVGKTRLVREIITQSEVFDGRALVGTCYSEGSTPYGPFRQILREVFRDESLLTLRDELSLPETVIADLLTLAPELRLRYPDVSENPPQDPQVEKQRLFENLTLFFVAVSDLSPLLVVVEDLQWADSGTLTMLRHLAHHTRRERMMIIITSRDVEPEEAPFLHELLLDFTRDRLTSQFKLPRLSFEETKELLAVMFAEEISSEFHNGIFNHTEGNPFFIEEVCKSIVESGKVYYAEGRWHRPGEISELEIPPSIRAAIYSRLRVLPGNTQEILNLAAVLGREFDFYTLADASDTGEEIVIEALDDAMRVQLIEEVSDEGGGTFAFVHSLIPATLVESLRSLQRRRMHHRAGLAIESQRPEDYDALAHHFSKAGTAEKAVEYLLLAGDRSRRLYANQDAIGYYQDALDFLKRTGDLELAARTYMKLGLTYHNAFDFEASRQAYQEGFVFWQRAADIRRSAHEIRASAPHPLRITFMEPETITLGWSMDFPSLFFLDLIFSGMAELSPEMDVVPEIAHSWEVLEDGCKYVFHLRDDVHWSDGSMLTARDFEFTFKQVLDPTSKRNWYHLLLDIKNAEAFREGIIDDPRLIGVRALDDYTLVVDLEGPTSYFPFILAYLAGYPMPKHVVESHGEDWSKIENIVSNGPFKLLSWDKGKSIILERNQTFHGRFIGNVETIKCNFITGQPDKYIQMYADDELDICGGLPLTEIANARQRFANEYASGPWLSTDFLGFDIKQPPFDSLLVRQALTMATDREMLADVILRGFAFPATGGLIPSGMPGHSPDIGLPYDPERARYLFKKAGFPGGRDFPTINCLVRDDPGHDLASEYLQAQWQEALGVMFTWDLVEWGGYYQRFSEREPHCWMAAWFADYPDPDDILRVNWWLDTGGWQDEAFKELVEGARRVIDQGERMLMYQQADKLLVEEVPLLPLCYGRFHLLVKPWVKNLYTSPLKWWSWKDIIIEPH